MATGANQHRYGELVDYRSQIELLVRLGGQNCGFLIFVFKKSLRRPWWFFDPEFASLLSA